MWERLDGVDGNTTFCMSSFRAFRPHAEPSYADVLAASSAAAEAAAASGHHDADADFALALQLQLQVRLA